MSTVGTTRFGLPVGACIEALQGVHENVTCDFADVDCHLFVLPVAGNPSLDMGKALPVNGADKPPPAAGRRARVAFRAARGIRLTAALALLWHAFGGGPESPASAKSKPG